MMEDISLRTIESTSSNNVDVVPTSPSIGTVGGGPKLFSATLCCYTACDFENPIVGCRGKSDGVCFNRRACLDPSAEGLGIGVLNGEKEANEIFKVGAHCCSCAIKKPELKCSSAGQLLCMKSAKSLPFDPDYVNEPICACCFLQLFPRIGCLNDAPECPSHDSLADIGDGTLTTFTVAREAIRSSKMER